MKPPISTEQIRGAYTGGSFDAELIRRLCDEIDRLRAEAKPTPQQQQEGKMVQVRVAIGVEPTGKWNAFGWAGGTDAEKMELAVEPLDPGEARYWLTATLPVPEEREIEATVDTATTGETATSGGRE